ncbi:dihydrolipoamide acetyltransferase family protein [Vibrio diazotrophicus]|uniref:dihydrolipoamide acetyltransferase family protein n=1 Tax=Vibrio diazotrophicus TaxID=685 RepID=UPI00142E1EB1|nr:dihydrolipoamide acetyltransferase family protein [Vibrio diazotrophicus]NIY91853.1 2-oxo acid dehydrogenase subunit E2 [Vibrio diazotrophicus]
MDNNKSNTVIDITMPALGADMSEGTLLEWLVKPNDLVDKGAIIAVIETSKGAIDMESYHRGKIRELLVSPGTKLAVGSVMAHMDSDEKLTEATPLPAVSPAPIQEVSTKIEHESPIEQAAIRADDKTPLKDIKRTLASPLVRKTAYLSGLDLTGIVGTGPQGAIIYRDLANAARLQEAKESKPNLQSDSSNMSPMRQAISDAMSRSKREIPHYYLSLEIDLTKAQKWLGEQNQNREPEHRLLLPALLLRAIADQLTHFPELNGFYVDGRFTPSPSVNIGNTISLREGGLVIPAIINADQLSLDQLMEALRDLAERSRRGRLRSSEISEGTITVTSIGDRGADSITGVIYPPQVAIIGLGRLRQAAVVKEEHLNIGEVMTVTLAADHRVSDGITGARFLRALAKQLQHPEAL